MIDLSVFNAGYESVLAGGISAGDCPCDCTTYCTCSCDCPCTCGHGCDDHSCNWDGPYNTTRDALEECEETSDYYYVRDADES